MIKMFEHRCFGQGGTTGSFLAKEAQNVSEVTENRCRGRSGGPCLRTLVRKPAAAIVPAGSTSIHLGTALPTLVPGHQPPRGRKAGRSTQPPPGLSPFCSHGSSHLSTDLSLLGGCHHSFPVKICKCCLSNVEIQSVCGKDFRDSEPKDCHKHECYRGQAVYEHESGGPLHSRKACTWRAPGALSEGMTATQL